MGIVKKWKVFFNKENIDFSEGLIDPYEFHKTFYIFVKLFRILDNETIPKWTILTPIFVAFCGIIAVFQCSLSTMHNVKIFDVPLATESCTYLIIMVYKLYILSSTFTHLPFYHSLLQALRDDFKYICTVGSRYRKKFFANHLITFQACFLTSLFITLTGFGLMVSANINLIFYFVTFDKDKPGQKPLPFPWWFFDINMHESPYHEPLFVFANMCIASQVYTYIFMLQTEIVWVRQIISKADIIIWSIQDLLLDVHPATTTEEKEYFSQLIQSKMRHIIVMHQSMNRLLDNYAAIYKNFLIYEQTFAGPVICLTAFCAAEKLDEGDIPGILVLLCVSIIVLIFIPCYLCTLLAVKVQSISDACWDCPFWNAGPVIRPYLVLMMQRVLRPLPIQAAGFKDVSLETYANKITTAYSCFNMLRQSNFEV